MLKNNYMRLAIILQSSSGDINKSSVQKMIQVALYDNCKNGNFLPLSVIVSRIKDMFALNFTEQELLNVIQEDQNGTFEIKANQTTNEYRLTINAIKTTETMIAESNDKYELKKILNAFIDTSGKKILIDDLEKLIMDFIYKAFSSNVSALSTILNSSCQIDDVASDFKNEQKEIINEFINWENKEKSEFVCNLVALSYQYCCLNARDNTELTEGVFKNKKFYLDTNVIFRLIGLNNKERQAQMNAFIKKCQDAGIEVKYTNFTKQEINESIRHHIDMIKHTYSRTRKNAPISPSHFENFAATSSDFYELYYQWACCFENNKDDYKSFQRYVNECIEKIISNFTAEDADSTKMLKPDEFERFKKSLTKSKQREGKMPNEYSITHDVENFFFLRAKNKDQKTKGPIPVDNFIITADQVFIRWAKEMTPSEIPAVVLPSTWYGILLQLNGRSDDDCIAFTQFLKLRISESLTPEMKAKRKKILDLVINMDESKDITGRILEHIKENFNNNKYRRTYTPEDIVDEAKKSILSAIEEEHQLDIDETRRKARNETIVAMILESCIKENKKTCLFNHAKLIFFAIIFFCIVSISIFLIKIAIIAIDPHLLKISSLSPATQAIITTVFSGILLVIPLAPFKQMTGFLKRLYINTKRAKIFRNCVIVKCKEQKIDTKKIYPEGIENPFDDCEKFTTD